MTETIDGNEIVSRHEALHEEIKTIRAAVHGTGTHAPNSNELHDFYAALDKHFRVSAPNVSAYLNELRGS